jgi:hypothetical protein
VIRLPDSAQSKKNPDPILPPLRLVESANGGRENTHIGLFGCCGTADAESGVQLRFTIYKDAD